MFSERIYEKMYKARAAGRLERGVTQADVSRRRGVIREALAGVDIAVWDTKTQALHTADELGLTRRGKAHFAVGAPALLGRRNAERIEPLRQGGNGLVSCEDPFATEVSQAASIVQRASAEAL